MSSPFLFPISPQKHSLLYYIVIIYYSDLVFTTAIVHARIRPAFSYIYLYLHSLPLSFYYLSLRGCAYPLTQELPCCCPHYCLDLAACRLLNLPTYQMLIETTLPTNLQQHKKTLGMLRDLLNRIASSCIFKISFPCYLCIAC